MPRHFTFSFMGDEPLAHRSATISNKKKQTYIRSGSVKNTSQMQRTTPSPADVRPPEHSSLTTNSAKTGIQAPLKDVSNTKVPNTDAAPPKVAKRPDADAATSNKITVQLSEGNLHLLNQVSSQWRTGKGRSQTSKCLDAIRICLGNDISPADVANHVAKDLEADIQAMEFKRARECATRISISMEKQATREGGAELQKKRVTTFEELEEHLKTLKLHPEQAPDRSRRGNEERGSEVGR